MVKTKFKKAVSLVLAAVMSLTAFMGIGATTAFAAVGEKADVYLVDYPRSGDTNNNGEWGHGNLNYMNGWKGLSTKYTGLRAMGSYSGNIAYCIEPGTGQRTGDTLTEKDENFFNNISPNGTISGDDIRLLIGRILQYGYRGGISTSWKSQNESDANCIAHAYATQILIWETIVGERDAGFNHVSTGGYNAVLECVSSAHPLRSKILSYYNSMVSTTQTMLSGVLTRLRKAKTTAISAITAVGITSFMTNAPRSKERGAGMSNSSEKKKRYNIPLWCKPNLSIEEAAAYSGIGMGKLYEMTESQDCPFVLWIGSRRMIKRKVFDEFIERQYSI